MAEELHVSEDDLAVQAAKEKLAALADRPGYREAIAPKGSGSRVVRIVLLAVAIGFGGLAFASCTEVAVAWLRVVLGIVCTVIAALSGLLAIGASPQPAPQAWPAAVIAKTIERAAGAAGGKQSSPVHTLTLLRDDGTPVKAHAIESVHALLRAGDVGVAHVRPSSTVTLPLVIGFHRL